MVLRFMNPWEDNDLLRDDAMCGTHTKEVVHPQIFGFPFLALCGGPHDCHLWPLKRRWLWEKSDPSLEVPSDCSTSTLRIDGHQFAVKDVAESVQLPNVHIRSWFCTLLNFCFKYRPDCLLWKFLTTIMLRAHGINCWQICIQLRLPFQTGAIKILEISRVFFFVFQHGSYRGWMKFELFCYDRFFLCWKLFNFVNKLNFPFKRQRLSCLPFLHCLCLHG